MSPEGRALLSRRAAAAILVLTLLAGCFAASKSPDATQGGTTTPASTTTGSVTTTDTTAPRAPLPLRLARVIDTALANPSAPFEAFDAAELNVADLMGDGRLEIVSLNDNLRTYVFDPNRGTVLAELTTLHIGEDSWMARDINGVAIGDVTGNGSIDLAILNGSATLTILELNRTASTPTHFVFHRVWRQIENAADFDPAFNATHPWYTNASRGMLGADGNPFIAHLPGMAGGIVLSQTDGLPGDFAFNPNGTLRWSTDFWDGNAGAWAGRLKPNEPVRAVFATDGGDVVAYDVGSGAIQWVFATTHNGANPGSISVMPNVYDLRGDGRMSVFVGARVAVNDTAAFEAATGTVGNATDWMLRQHAIYYLLDADGRQVWNASFPWGNPMVYMRPAALDLNGDGVKDLVAIDWNTIGHHPGNWEKLRKANLFALDGATGRALWNTSVDASWSNKGIAIADFLGTGRAQILVEEQSGQNDGLSLYGLDGKFIQWMPLQIPGWRITRGPILADIDGDGFANVIVPVARPATTCAAGDEVCRKTQTAHCLQTDVGCRMGAILIFDTKAPNASVQFSANTRYDSSESQTMPVARN